MTLATIICILILVDNIGTNTFGDNVLRLKRLQSDIMTIEIIAGVQETIVELIFLIRPRRIIIPSNTTNDILNGNAIHDNIPSYYRTEDCIEDLIVVSSKLW